ncbi:GFA family protein [Oceaniglobus ichthyenteri]|uniref:GFA family protein n=1 Tax=Oceaniglobus ichthyenteri TaxID=2136177 RepID=UPI000D390BAA|nr:GFA family protein [Oceaniglobus ichthyenteri]
MSTGSCLCGAVSYLVRGPLFPVVACHCTQCRKSSGHFAALTSAARELVLISGEVTWYPSSEIANRGFCATCGSSLFWDGPGPDLSIHAGTLDDSEDAELIGHIFCAEKGAYYEITDDLPCLEYNEAE